MLTSSRKIRDMGMTRAGAFFLYRVSRAATSGFTLSATDRFPREQKKILLEAGERGWAEPAPGLLELEQSAADYLGEGAVVRFSVSRKSPYLLQVFRELRRQRPSHYFYDTRTGSQHPVWGSVQALAMAILLEGFSVVPITILTNFPARRWRRQVAAVTARRGLILALLPLEVVRSVIPHGRVLGPIFMPFSRARMNHIRAESPESMSGNDPFSITFIGSVYEPRRSVIQKLREEFSDSKIEFVVHERDPIGPKIDRKTYWKVLRAANLVFTTADHIEKRGADDGCPQHMVYRYTEALVAESCLVAPDLGSALVPWRHFIPFTSPEELRKTLEELVEEPERIAAIRREGAEFIRLRIENNQWWREVDDALGQDCLLR